MELLKFFSDNAATLIILAVLFAVVILVLIYMIKQKKKGGCSGCSSCSGCNSCAMGEGARACCARAFCEAPCASDTDGKNKLEQAYQSGEEK